MVGHDEVHAEFFRLPHFIRGGYAAVDGNHEVRPAAAEAAQGVRIHAVSLGEPVGDVVRDVAPERGEEAAEKGRSGDPVHVEVSVDRDLFLFVNGFSESLHGLVHPLHEKRGGKVGKRGTKKRLRLLDRAYPPVHEQPGDKGQDPELFRNFPGGPLGRFRHRPFSGRLVHLKVFAHIKTCPPSGRAFNPEADSVSVFLASRSENKSEKSISPTRSGGHEAPCAAR